MPQRPVAPQPPDRHQFVAGWQIEDLADPSGEDPYRRTIRMRRQGEDWSVRFEFVEGAVAASTERNREANVGNCAQGHGGPDWGGSAADQARDAREDLARLIADAQRSCDRTTDITSAALAGFDAAFAVAFAWDRERIALLAPLRPGDEAEASSARNEASAASAEMDPAMDDMYMDSNALDMSMDMNSGADVMSSEMNASDGAEANSADPPN